jgi:hypothetical protein
MNPTITGSRHDQWATATPHAPGGARDASLDEPLAAELTRRATRPLATVGRAAAPEGSVASR